MRRTLDLPQVMSTLTVNAPAMRAALSLDMLATDLAYYLVRRGLPFREAHHASGRCVAAAEAKSLALADLPLEDFASAHPLFGKDVKEVFDFERSVEQYTAAGGTARAAVAAQASALRQWLA